MAYGFDGDDELIGYEEHLRDSQNLGDARRCPHHPHVKTSSDDGMFDAPCYECEAAMDEAADLEHQLSEVETTWQAERRTPVHGVVPTEDVDDDIPF